MQRLLGEKYLHEMFGSWHAADDNRYVDLDYRCDEHGKHVPHAVVGLFQDDSVISVHDTADAAADGIQLAITSTSSLSPAIYERKEIRSHLQNSGQEDRANFNLFAGCHLQFPYH